MNVRLISLTKPFVAGETGHDPELVGYGQLTAEELLVYIARVSNPSNQLNTETSDKLIKYMIDHKHWSPFDMINLCVEVTTSKAIGIQILRHWSIKPQEFSQRYAEVTDIEPIELRKNGAKNRQSSEEVFDPTLPESVFNDMLLQNLSKDLPASYVVGALVNSMQALYGGLLEAGVAKECARMVLPMATSTTMYLNGSIRSWIHYMQQRCDQHAQLEHREVAEEIKKIFVANFPMTAKALGINE
jgi:thymidylate synthase (FAD)